MATYVKVKAKGKIKARQMIVSNDDGTVSAYRIRSRLVFRTVRKDGTIQWNHRYWKPNGETPLKLIGQRLAFGTYAPECNVLYLWGIEGLYRGWPAPDLLHVKETALFKFGNIKLVAGCYIAAWWYPVEEGGI